MIAVVVSLKGWDIRLMSEPLLHIKVGEVSECIDRWVVNHKDEVEKYNIDYANWSVRWYKVQHYLTERKLRNFKYDVYTYMPEYHDFPLQKMLASSQPTRPSSVTYYPLLKKLQTLCLGSKDGVLVLDHESVVALNVAREWWNE